MLKTLPRVDLSNQSNTKCGEIFFNSFTNFTILCTFCQMKCFKYEDFLLHLKNVHFENNLPRTASINTECNKHLELSVNHVVMSLDREVTMRNSSDQSYDINANDDNVYESCEEQLMVLTNFSRKGVFYKRKKIKISKCDKSVELCDRTSDFGFNSKGDATVIKKIIQHSCFKKKKEKYICPDCNNLFVQKKYLDRHVLELHDGYKCSLCEKRFRRSYHLTGHLKTHSSKKDFICPIEKCGRGFTDREYLKRHLEVHTMERTFICEYENCGKAFHTQRRLSTHKYTHKIPKKLVCDMCGYSCRSKTELLTHQRIHTGEKPYACNVCSKSFVSKTALTEHMISHSKNRPHVCQTCKAAFANRRVLLRHIYIHSDEKTFKCKMCESAFKHPNSLQGHIRNVHRDSKPPTLTSHSVM